MQNQGVDIPPNPPMGIGTTSGVAEINRSLMKRQLALLLHSEQCRLHERNGTTNDCVIRHCFTMRQVLSHIEKCIREDDCAVPHCRTSKIILRHFHSCNRRSCDVCCAVQKPEFSFNKSESTESHNGPFYDLPSEMKSNVALMNGIKTTHGEAMGCTPIATMNGDVYRSNNRNNLHLTDQQRELAMKKFVNVSLSIIPTANSTAYSDPNMRQFLEHVKRMEKDIFMKSKSDTEYYAALTTCYQSIHSELKEKRRLRRVRSTDANAEQSDLVSVNAVMENSHRKDKNCHLPDIVTTTSDSQTFKTDELSNTSPNVLRPTTASKNCSMTSENSESSCPCTVDPLGDVKSLPPSVPVKKPFDSQPPSVSEVKQEPSTCSDQIKEENPPAGSVPVRESSARTMWYPNDLLRSFLPVVERISKEKDAEPFLQPVDWESLEIYDYPQVVSHPMDLSTIRKKLENREYKDPWSVVDDFWLMLNNAWLYNKKTSKVYKTCTRLAEIFETVIDPVMQSLSFCCGRDYYYQPPPLTCLTPKFCTIHRDAVYYIYKNENHTPGLLEQNYTICERCYNEAADEIRLDSESPSIVTVQKSLLEKCKNDKKEKEPFVFCRRCGRKWHRVCAIYSEEVWPEGFICDRCVKDHGLKRPENRFTARKLATCKLSNFLEKRVNDFLKKKGVNTGDVIIRVLAAADKTVEVKPGMKSRFCESGDMPESFPYRVKAIFAFQEIDGYEVCFFGLHVQEYGSECPPPNTRRVYLAYLDSVYFFRPKQYRTDIYHELLVGYIHYAKLLGYTVAHIWACPPSEGDDYIFHMHPNDQKIPKPKRLQEWYQKMLKKALLERIVVDYKDICQDACESRLVSPTELAYFEGDFWPNTLEELFKEMDEEDARRKREQEALAQDDEEDETKECVQTRETDCGSSGNPGKKKAKKRKLKRNASLSLTGKRKRLSGTGCADLVNEVARRVYEIMEKHKENFFVIRLHPQNAVSTLSPIRDPDPLVSSDLMECRGAFLERAREKHLEFSSIRRAKYSTLVMLYDLHNENRQPLMYTCNVCNVQLENPWHCKQCVEYDLCPRCYDTEQHPHPMVQVGLGLDDNSKGPDLDSEGAAVQESGRDKLSRLVKALGHGCSCRDANCRVYACKTMKSNVQHFRVHASAARNQCSICRSLSFLCYYHSKTCHELKCPVPLCPKLRAKMKQQQKQQRLEQTQMLRRRMATMQRYNSVTPGNQNSQMSQHPNSSTSECVSSPAANCTQLSPYATPVACVTTTSSFNSSASPARTPASLPSPQQMGVHHQSVQQVVHSKQAVLASNTPSTNLTSPQHLVSSTHSSASPYHVQQTLMCTDSIEVGPNYPYQPIGRSQSVVAPTAMAIFPSTNHPSSAGLHPLERSHSAQFSLGPIPQRCISSSHSSLSRLSPGSSQFNSAPLSPRCQQTYPSPMVSSSDSSTLISQSAYPISLRTPQDGPHSPYSLPKTQLHPQQFSQNRYPSQPSINGDYQNATLMASNQPPNVVTSMNPGWRYTVPSQSCNTAANIYTSGPTQQLRCATSPCNPNVLVARPHQPTVPSPIRNCGISPPSSSIGVSSEEVHIVKQTYSEMRQRGAPISEFSSWLNANPHLIRAWQFIQQSHVCAQQAEPSLGSVANSFPSQSASSYPMGPVVSPSTQLGSTARFVRHSTHARMRSVSSQPHYPYYSQPSKMGGPAPQTVQQQFNSVHSGIPSNMPQALAAPVPVSLSPPYGTPNRVGAQGPTHQFQQQQQLIRPSGVSHSAGSNVISGSTFGVGSIRSNPSHPQYSSVMLSQLLGPCQTGGGPSSSPISSNFTVNSFSISQQSHQQAQSMSRVDFAPPSGNISGNQLYPDGSGSGVM